jgi:hypothetical protein
LFGDNLTVGFTHRDTIAVRGAHHHAFHDSLAAHQRLFAALQYGQHLNVRAKAQKASDRQGDRLLLHYTAKAPGRILPVQPIQY